MQCNLKYLQPGLGRGRRQASATCGSDVANKSKERSRIRYTHHLSLLNQTFQVCFPVPPMLIIFELGTRRIREQSETMPKFLALSLLDRVEFMNREPVSYGAMVVAE